MKLFGEFLVEQKKIDAEQLLNALIHQMKELPILPEILVEQRLLSVPEVLELLKTQQINRISFHEALKNSKKWDETLSQKMDEALAKKRVPLGEILIKQSLISLDDLNRCLDEFLSSESMPQKAELMPEPAPKDTIPQSSGHGDQALEQALKSPIYEPESKVLNLKNLTNLSFQVHRLRGSLKLTNIEHADEFLKKFEAFLSLLQKKDPKSFNSELLGGISNLLKKLLELVSTSPEIWDSKLVQAMDVDLEFNLFNLSFSDDLKGDT